MKSTTFAFEIIGSVVLNWILQNFTVFLFLFSLYWVQPSMARASLCSSKCGKLSPFLSTVGSWRITFKTHQVTWTDVDAYGACEFMNWKCVCVHAGVLSVSAEAGTPPIRRRVSILLACITCRHLAAGSGTSSSATHNGQHSLKVLLISISHHFLKLMTGVPNSGNFVKT